MAAKTKTRGKAKHPQGAAKSRKLLAPKVKSKVGRQRLREAVKAVQEAAEAA